MSDIVSRVKTEIENAIGSSLEDIKEEARLYEDLYVDPVDMIMLAMDLEEEFDIEIKDEVVPSWKSVQDVINYITKRMEEKNG